MSKHIFWCMAMICCVVNLSWGQSSDEYYVESSGGDIFATHSAWDNHSVVLADNGNVAIWGTTLIDGGGNERVFLQGVQYPFTNPPGLVFDGIYDNSTCGSGPFSGQSRFHGMVDDKMTGINQVVVASTFYLPYPGGAQSGALVIFSIDPTSGAVNWVRHLFVYGDITQIKEVSIIQDNNGDFVIAYDFREAYPTYPTPFYGLGVTRLDPVGNVIWLTDYILGTVDTDNPFTLHHVIHDQSNGLYVLAGEYDLTPVGGTVEPFILQVDEGSGGLVNPLFHYDFPAPIGGITEVNGLYYISFTTPGGLLAMGEIDPSGILTNVFEYDLPSALLNGGTSEVYSHDLIYNPNSNYFDLLLNYTDGVSNSYGMGFVDYSNPMVIEYTEYEYDPGNFEGTPVSFTDLQPSLTFAFDDRLALIHPDGALVPGASAQEVVKLELFQLGCISQNGESQPMNPNIYNTNAVTLNDLVQGWSCNSKVNPVPYTGNIYDCGGGFITNYRQANVAPTDVKQELTLQVYPNPVQEALILDVDFTESLQTKLIDPMGKIVMETTDQTKLDVRALPPGVYILEVIADQQRFVESILIER